MSWSLVACIEKNGSESEVVFPTKWIRGEWLYFSNSLRAERDMHNMIDLKENWPRYKVLKVKVTSGKFTIFCTHTSH